MKGFFTAALVELRSKCNSIPPIYAGILYRNSQINCDQIGFKEFVVIFFSNDIVFNHYFGIFLKSAFLQF